MGIDFFEEILSHIGFQDHTLRPAIQTNGTRLNKDWINLFKRYCFSVGVSIDGDKASHDRHRRYSGGRGSYDVITQNVGRLREAGIRCGAICVANPDASGELCYESIRDLGISVIDLLLPLATWGSEHSSVGYQEALSDYLFGFLKGWLPEASGVRLRLFDVMFSRAIGKDIEYSGLGAVKKEKFIVLETDGILHHDEDRFTHEFRDTNHRSYCKNIMLIDDLKIFEEAVDVSLDSIGAFVVPDNCSLCDVNHICRSGMLASRYSADRGFNNASAHCSALKALCRQVQRLSA